MRLYPFERFSENTKGVLTLAHQEAESHGDSWIGTEHLLLGLMREGHGVAGTALRDLGQELSVIRADIDRILQSEPKRVGQKIMPTSRVKRVIEIAFGEAQRDNSSVVETGHILVGLLLEADGIAAQVLRKRGVTVDRVRSEIRRLRDSGMVESISRRLANPQFADAEGAVIRIDSASQVRVVRRKLMG